MIKIKKLLLLIIVITTVVFIIYTTIYHKKVNYVIIGDSLSMGINPYNEKGYGFKDYIIEYYKEKNEYKSHKEYVKKEMTMDDILIELKINLDLKKDLRESHLVTITLGLYDFLDKIEEFEIKNIKEYKEEIKKLIAKQDQTLKEIRKYAKNKIILIGYYNPIPLLFNTNEQEMDDLFNYINDVSKEICAKYNIEYIETYYLFKENKFLDNPNNIHPNLDGYKTIFSNILPILKK